MIQDSIFRAYDIRGRYPSEINEEVVGEIISRFLANQSITNKLITVVIGHDARLSSPALYKSAQDSLSPFTFHLLPVGLITTPEMYFLVNNHNADFGIMITASHNLKEYNGIKIVGPKATPISGKDIYIAINKSLKIKV